MTILDSFRLDGRVALVTGAGSGIGRGLAAAMVEAGAATVCADIDRERAEVAAAELSGYGTAWPSVADVAEEADCERMCNDAVERGGRLDVVFCNAGIVLANETFLEAKLTSWRRETDVNLTGAWLTARSAARRMVALGQGGSIVFTASIYGLVGSFEPTSGAYQAAKGAVVNLTRDLAVQLAPHQIRVNALAPGFIRTALGSGRLLRASEETRSFEDEVTRRTPLGRVGEPDDLKGAGLFLASPASAYVTGVTLPVDGGWLAL